MIAEIISLPSPQETGATLFAALQKRASVRDYTADPLTTEQLSGILWAAAGRNRPDSRLTAPSAMALYPIRTYAVLRHGVYLYDAAEHKLVLVKKGNFVHLVGMQDFVYTAPLNIMYIADLSVYTGDLAKMPETVIMCWCSLDAAGYCQNANVWAAAHGLGSITRATAKGVEFLKAIDAPPYYRFALAQSVGVPAK